MGNYKISKEIRNYPMLGGVLSLIPEGGVLAGGAFKRLMKNEDPKDLDIFFFNQDNYNNAVLAIEGERIVDNERVRVYRPTQELLPYVTEYILIDKDSAEDLLNAFDFTITKMALFKDELSLNKEQEWTLLYHEDFFEHLIFNRLVLDNEIPFPASSFERSLRYASYGYNLCRESKVKLTKAINALDETSINISKSFYDGWD